MSILKVARMGHPVLRMPARTLERSEIKQPVIQQLIDDMIETMREYQGVGLAAPQVHKGIHLFVAAISPEEEDEEDDERPPEDVEPLVFINPVITPVGTDSVEDWEGCLSIPEVRGRVPRAHAIKVTAFDRLGGSLELSSRGFPARVIQHETDHLNGVLFLDRMKALDSLTFLAEYARYWKERE